MNIPKSMDIYCKWCKKHTTQKVGPVKKHTKRKLSLGERRFRRKMKGYGSFPKPMPSGKKPTQRNDLRYTCGDCKKMSIRRGTTYRVKKFEIVEKHE